MSSTTQPRNFAVIPIRRSAAEKRHAADQARAGEHRAKRKIDQANRVLDALDARVDRYALQIARLQRRKALACARIEMMEQRIIVEMEAGGVRKLDGFRSALATRPATAAVDVLNESAIPDHLCRIETKRAPLKALIKAALMQGVAVPGVRLTVGTSLLRTKEEGDR